MIIDLIKLDKTPYRFSFAIAPEEIDLGDELIRLKGETLVAGVLTQHIAETEVTGKIIAVAEIECTRCLTPIENRFEIEFEAVFIASEHYTEAKETELNLRDLNVSVIENNEIDVSELVREQILLNLPEQIFCKEDCQGLCLKCGANRNLKSCNCEEKEIDPRWAVLKNLK